MCGCFAGTSWAVCRPGSGWARPDSSSRCCFAGFSWSAVAFAQLRAWLERPRCQSTNTCHAGRKWPYWCFRYPFTAFDPRVWPVSRSGLFNDVAFRYYFMLLTITVFITQLLLLFLLLLLLLLLLKKI